MKIKNTPPIAPPIGDIVDHYDPVLRPPPARDVTLRTGQLGGQLRNLAERIAATDGSSVQFVLLSIIIAVAGLIGRRTRFQVRPGHEEPVSLFGILIGPSRTGKSRGMAAVMNVLQSIGQEENSGEADPTDPTTKIIVQERLAIFKKEVRAALESGAATPPMSEDLERALEKVGPPQLMITKASAAGLERSAVESRHGILLVNDELTTALTREPREFALRAFDGGPSTKTLASGSSSGNAIMSVLGATTSSRVRELGLDRTDGLSGRSLVAYTAKPPVSLEALRDPSVHDELNVLLRKVRKLELPPNLTLDPDAAKFIEETAESLRREYRYHPEAVQAAVRGAQALLVRIAGVLTVIYAAFASMRSEGATPDRRISLRTARAAVDLYVHHCVPSLCELLETEGKDPIHEAIMEMTERMIERDKTHQVSLRDLRRRSGQFGMPRALVDDVVTTAIGMGVARRTSQQRATGRPSEAIVLHPKFVDAYEARKAEREGVRVDEPAGR